MKITLAPGVYAMWHRSHTINYFIVNEYGEHVEYDVSSLYPSDGRRPTQVEVMDAIIRREVDEGHLVYPVDTMELILCADCIHMDANGSLPDNEPRDAVPLAKIPGWLLSPNETDHVCEGHFAYGCDGCNTRLGGLRYCYVGVER